VGTPAARVPANVTAFDEAGLADVLAVIPHGQWTSLEQL
jgi:hypothetical protein